MGRGWRVAADVLIGAAMLLLAVGLSALFFPRLPTASGVAALAFILILGAVASLLRRRAIPTLSGVVGAAFLSALGVYLLRAGQRVAEIHASGDLPPSRLELALPILFRAAVLGVAPIVPFLLGYLIGGVGRLIGAQAPPAAEYEQGASGARVASSKPAAMMSWLWVRALLGTISLGGLLLWWWNPGDIRQRGEEAALEQAESPALGPTDEVESKSEPVAPRHPSTHPADVWVDPELGMRFRYIPPGRFVMGSAEDEAGLAPHERRHSVEITRGFWMGETEVTHSQWRALMGKKYTRFREHGDDLPVERVTWWEASAFANELSRRSGIEPVVELVGCEGRPGDGMECQATGALDLSKPGYRLPTEAEWEYAARAGVGTAFWTGAELTTDQANFNPPRELGVERNLRKRPVRVGSYAPNPWGLRDVHGNVSEWVWDAQEAYSSSPVIDPTGRPTATSDTPRIARGGSWKSRAVSCRSAARSWLDPNARELYLGFRVLRTFSSGPLLAGDE